MKRLSILILLGLLSCSEKNPILVLNTPYTPKTEEFKHDAHIGDYVHEAFPKLKSAGWATSTDTIGEDWRLKINRWGAVWDVDYFIDQNRRVYNVMWSSVNHSKETFLKVADAYKAEMGAPETSNEEAFSFASQGRRVDVDWHRDNKNSIYVWTQWGWQE